MSSLSRSVGRSDLSCKSFVPFARFDTDISSTLVDLPGLIHAANKMQSDEDVKLIKELVLEYMKNERTIILAVVSAKNGMAST